MNDRELLKLAAKAADYIFTEKLTESAQGKRKGPFISHRQRWKEWAPLTDDGDALRLAVDCGIGMRFHDGWGEVFHPTGHLEFKYNGDKQTTTRFAISMLASEIGKGMK